MNADTQRAVATVVATTVASTSTVAPASCERRVVTFAATVRAEPKISARADDHIAKGRLLCVALTSKSGRWVYVRYAAKGADAAAVCNGELTACSVGWVSKRLTASVPNVPEVSTTVGPTP